MHYLYMQLARCVIQTSRYIIICCAHLNVYSGTPHAQSIPGTSQGVLCATTIMYKYKKQLKIIKISRDGCAKKYTNKGSRESDRQGAPYTIFLRLCRVTRVHLVYHFPYYTCLCTF